jgi:hypothetical protein
MHNVTPRVDFIVAEQGEHAYRAIWRALVGQKTDGTFCCSAAAARVENA